MKCEYLGSKAAQKRWHKKHGWLTPVKAPCFVVYQRGDTGSITDAFFISASDLVNMIFEKTKTQEEDVKGSFDFLRDG